MLRFIVYIILTYFIYLFLKLIINYIKKQNTLKTKIRQQEKNNETEKIQIDKDKIIDAEYEDIK